MSKKIDDPRKPSSPVSVTKPKSLSNSAIGNPLSVSSQQLRTSNDASSNNEGSGIDRNSPGGARSDQPSSRSFSRGLLLSPPSDSPSSSTSDRFRRQSPVGDRMPIEANVINGSSDGLQACSVSFNPTVNVADAQSPGRSSRAWLKPETPITDSSSRTLNGDTDDEKYNLAKYLNKDREPRSPSPHSRPSPHSPSCIRHKPPWPHDRKHTANKEVETLGHKERGRVSPYISDDEQFLPHIYKGFSDRSLPSTNKNELSSVETNFRCGEKRASSDGGNTVRKLSNASEAAPSVHGSVCEENVCNHIAEPKSLSYVRAPVGVTYEYDIKLELLENEEHVFLDSLLTKYNCNLPTLRKAVARCKALRSLRSFQQEAEDIRNRSSSKHSKGAKSRESSSDRTGRNRSLSKSRQKHFSSKDSKKNACPQDRSTDSKNLKDFDIETGRKARSRSSIRLHAFKDVVISKFSSKGRQHSNSISSSSKSTNIDAKSTLPPVEISIVDNEGHEVSARSLIVPNNADIIVGTSSTSPEDGKIGCHVSEECPNIMISDTRNAFSPSTDTPHYEINCKLKSSASTSDAGQSSIAADRKHSGTKGKQKHSSSSDSKKNADSSERNQASDSNNANASDVETERRKRNRSSSRLQAIKDAFIAKFSPKGLRNNKSSSSSLKSSDVDPKSTLSPAELSYDESEAQVDVLASPLIAENSTDAMIGQASACTHTAMGQPSASMHTVIGLPSTSTHTVPSANTDTTVGQSWVGRPSTRLGVDKMEYCGSRKYSKNSMTSDAYITFPPGTDLSQDEMNSLTQQGLIPITFNAELSPTSNERQSSTSKLKKHSSEPLSSWPQSPYLSQSHVSDSFSSQMLDPSLPHVTDSSLPVVPDFNQPRAPPSFLLPEVSSSLPTIESQDLEKLIIIFGRHPVKAPKTTFRNNGSGEPATDVTNTSVSFSKPEEQSASNETESLSKVSNAGVNEKRTYLDNSDHRPSQSFPPWQSTDTVLNGSKN